MPFTTQKGGPLGCRLFHHPGDRSRIVPLTISVEDFHRLFVSQHTHVADLRKVGGLRAVRTHWR